MNALRTGLILVLILLCSQVLNGELYSWIDKKGVRHYSNDPPPKDEKVSGMIVWKQSKTTDNQDTIKVDRTDDTTDTDTLKNPVVIKGMEENKVDVTEVKPIEKKVQRRKIPKVTIYTTPTCGYCRLAKAFFKENKVSYTEYDVSQPSDGREQFDEMGGRGVPLIMVGERRFDGWNEEEVRSTLGL
jgi:glutaredoxin